MPHPRTIVAFVAALALAAVGASAQTYVYAVNFECGFQASADGSDGYEPSVKVANYAFKVDLYNPSLTENAGVTASVLEDTTTHAPSAVSPPTPITALFNLPFDSASLLDCSDVLAAQGGNPGGGKPFKSGVLIMRADRPLIVWATKTAEVCSGLFRLDPALVNDPDMLLFDEDGQLIPPGTPLPAAGPSLIGCPPAMAFHERYGGGLPSGPFSGPGGGVPPGLRSRQAVAGPGSDQIADDWSVSHSMDFERVEPLVLP